MYERDVRDRLVAEGERLFARPRVRVPFSGNPQADDLLNNIEEYPHAFLLACMMDRQVRSERAWAVPYLLSQRLGGFDLEKLSTLPFYELKRHMSEPEPLHRFPERMSENIQAAVTIITEQYGGDASAIWGSTPPSAEIIYQLLQFPGIGQKIATMTTNMLIRHFKIPLSDYSSIDISADVHVRRVFHRFGLVRKDPTIEDVVYRARSMHPSFPGIMDLPVWEIGRSWCKARALYCESCMMHEVCPAIED